MAAVMDTVTQLVVFLVRRLPRVKFSFSFSLDVSPPPDPGPEPKKEPEAEASRFCSEDLVDPPQSPTDPLGFVQPANWTETDSVPGPVSTEDSIRLQGSHQSAAPGDDPTSDQVTPQKCSPEDGSLNPPHAVPNPVTSDRSSDSFEPADSGFSESRLPVKTGSDSEDESLFIDSDSETETNEKTHSRSPIIQTSL